ncbi:hypothetical protein KY345_05545 [Candidatus Woesearchaeota archaeon]|nr:hypothetical protein [Candidatus Woesearchaeota archaeon]
MPETQYPQRPYQGQNTGQNFNTGMAQQGQYQQAQQQYAQPYPQQQAQQQYNQIPTQAQMTQQQKQYGQQIQTAPREPENYKSQINSKSRLAIIAVATLFGLIFIGSIVYFMLPKQQEVIQEKVVREEAPKVIALAPEQELIKKDIAIDEIKFCSDIDDNFYCYEEEDNTFDIGESVYVYVRIRGFSQVKREEGYLIGIREDVETLDPEGISVLQLSGTAANLADFISEGQNYLHLKNRLRIPADLVPGAYTLKINVMDKITGKEARLEKGFWLE